jgi:hypothetical protein
MKKSQLVVTFALLVEKSNRLKSGKKFKRCHNLKPVELFLF